VIGSSTKLWFWWKVVKIFFKAYKKNNGLVMLVTFPRWKVPTFDKDRQNIAKQWRQKGSINFMHKNEKITKLLCLFPTENLFLLGPLLFL